MVSAIQEHLGRTFREVAPDLADAAENAGRTDLPHGRAGPSRGAHRRSRRPSPGAQRHWITHWLPLKNERGEVVGINVAADEVTKEKQMQKALQDSEQRLRLVLDGGQMGRWEWDLQTDSMFWCQRVYDLLGLDARQPARGEAFLARVHPQDRTALETLMEKTLADRTDLQAEFRVIRERGEDPRRDRLADAAGQSGLR